VGAVIFVVLLYLIGMATMPKVTAEQKQLWMFAFAFGLVATHGEGEIEGIRNCEGEPVDLGELHGSIP
jgi:hypothetical protein